MARILIADDSRTVRAAVARLVEAMGHEPVAVASLHDAVDELERAPFDLLLLDVLTGDWGPLRRVQGSANKVRVVLFSGRGGDRLRGALDASAARFVVSKAGGVEPLEGAIDAVLRAGRPSEPG